MTSDARVMLYSTCPQSKDVEQGAYAARVREVAGWSEAAGCHGMLVYTDNGIVDPWIVAGHVIASTRSLRPLIAVQPVYMHPYAAAKMISTFACLHGRAVDLNLLAGGFRNDLAALGDDTPHDDRYVRTIEYATIVRQLVEGEGPVTQDGRYYQVSNLRLTPAVPAHLRPGLLISGSSEAGRAAARAIGAIAVRYPQPAEEEEDEDELRSSGIEHGIRVGIVARDDDTEAWQIARARFPEDRQGEIAHGLAMKVSDSVWHKQLSDRPQGGEEATSPYWLGPFKSYGTFCPYLVGTYDRVAQEIARYLAIGARAVITDIPREADDLLRARRVLDRALAMVAA